MKLATTTGDITQYGLPLTDAVRIITEAGFKHLDVSFYDLDRAPSPFAETGWEAYADSLLALAAESGADFVQCHTPGCTNPFYTGKRAARLYEATVRSIRAAARLGIRNAVIHAGWAPDLSEEASFVCNRAFLEQFIPVLEETGVRLLVENSTRVNMGEQYHFYDGETLARFVDGMAHPLIAVCWDVGHAHLEGHNYPDIMALGDRLCALHIHDNRGGADEHLPPFMGNINLDEILCALTDSGYAARDTYFTFEADYLFSPDRNRPPYAARPHRLAAPSRGMLLAGERLRFETGKHILESYGVFEG